MGFNGELEDIFRQQEAFHKLEENQYWNQVRIQAAIAAMQGILANPEHRLDYDNGEGDNVLPAIAIVSVKCADALVEELKKKK